MSLNGVALLEWLRPPPGMRTTAALGTSYSADLVACMVALTALDGAGGDSVSYGKIEALRALERLRARVRIAVQQGRISWTQSPSRPVLALLDTIVRPVPFDGREASFHPKVWVARQEGEDGKVRYVLTLGSRNLTTGTAWELGVGLVGRLAPERQKRQQRIDGIAEFVAHVGGLIGERSVLKRFPELAEVYWELPGDIQQIRFGYQAGQSAAARELKETELFKLSQQSRVLLISPFLDPGVIHQAAEHWKSATEIRLLAGLADLDAVAARGAREPLLRLQPHRIDVALEDAAEDDRGADQPARDDEDPEQREERGLHAKVVSVDDGERATVIVGSGNLTHRGWTGANCEAFLQLSGGTALAAALWAWSTTYGREYHPPEDPPDKPRKTAIEDARDRIPSLHFRLVEDAAGGVLSCEEGPLSFAAGVELRVARFSAPEEAVTWKTGVSSTGLPPCALPRRTAFVLFRLQDGDRAISWVQTVDVEPPMDDARDREAFIAVLGARGFLEFIQGMLPGADDAEPGDDEWDGDGGGGKRQKGVKRLEAAFRLEDLLRDLSRRPAAVKEIGAAVERYRGLVERLELAPEEKALLERFWKTWAAIRIGLEMK